MRMVYGPSCAMLNHRSAQSSESVFRSVTPDCTFVLVNIMKVAAKPYPSSQARKTEQGPGVGDRTQPNSLATFWATPETCTDRAAGRTRQSAFINSQTNLPFMCVKPLVAELCEYCG